MASCNTGKLSIKKKITIFSSVGLGIATATYLAFTTTNNPVVAAAIPALLSFAACPAMCVAVGGIIWFSSRFSRNKKKDNNNTSIATTKEQESCCSSGFSHINKKEQSQPRGIDVFESDREKDSHERDSTSILQQNQQVKFEN